jgi:D-sedoheptulose 7-phosphate isomerase
MIPITYYLTEVSRGVLEALSTISSEKVPLAKALQESIDWLKDARIHDRKVFLVGNGGSAAIASHAQNDLCKGAGIRAMVFNETPLLTAYTNDISYEAAFEQMLGLWAEPGDLLVAISSSGRSVNILNAVQCAKDAGCRTITLSGFRPDNPLRLLGDINIFVPSSEYGIVETAHATLLHYLTDAVKHES